MFCSETAYTPPLWSGFFSAEVSAAAALTGLLFVSISISLAKIIAFPQLAPRAAKALVTLVGILFAASLCLIPGQSKDHLAVELIVLGSLDWIGITWMQRTYLHANSYLSIGQKLLVAIFTQLSSLPIIACGISLHYMRGGGLYWLAGAVFLCFTSALLDAWVLLVEIQR